MKTLLISIFLISVSTLLANDTDVSVVFGKIISHTLTDAEQADRDAIKVAVKLGETTQALAVASVQSNIKAAVQRLKKSAASNQDIADILLLLQSINSDLKGLSQ